jgi:hypothetical protein
MKKQIKYLSKCTKVKFTKYYISGKEMGIERWETNEMSPTITTAYSLERVSKL